MNKSFRDKKVMLAAAALLGAISLSGCGDTSEEEKELAGFSASLAEFSEYMQEADEQINNLDTSRKESVDDLLEILDQMDAEFAEFAMIQVPAQYEGISELAKHASETMSEAVSCYHKAYESENFAQNYADGAYQFYTLSMNYVGYIGMILLGEPLPEDAHVTVYEVTNDENILDRWLSGDKDGDDDSTIADESQTASE